MIIIFLKIKQVILVIYNFNDKIFHTIDNNSDLKLPKIEYKFKFNKKI